MNAIKERAIGNDCSNAETPAICDLSVHSEIFQEKNVLLFVVVEERLSVDCH